MNAHRSSRPLLLAATAAVALLATVIAVGGADDQPLLQVAPTAVLAAETATTADTTAATDTRRDAAPRAAYDVRVGDRLQLACDLASRAALRQGDAAPQQIQLALAGAFELLVAARRADEIALVATAADVTVRGGTPEVARDLQAELRAGFAVRLGTDGALRGYRFQANADAERRNLIRTLMAGLRARLGDAGAATWHVVDADATGIAEFDGSATADRSEFRLHKVAYRGDAAAQLPAVDGEARLVLAPAAGWWQQVRRTERCRVALPEAKLVIEADSTLSADLVAVAHGDADAAFDWEAPWAAASGAEDRDEQADPLAAQLAAELRGATFTSEFAHLQQLVAADADDTELHTARLHLIWLLRNDPRALGELEGLLAAPGQSQRLLAEVLSAVGAADTKATQAFLAGRLAANGDQAQRVMVAQALFQGTGPAAPIVQAVREALAAGDVAPELTGTGMLLLGALANRADGAAAMQDLLARRDFARDHGLVVDWLEALGNSGNAAVVDAALPSFAAADVAERAAATSAVRNVDDPRANAALADRVEHDDSPIVRARAIEVLAAHADGNPALFLRVFEQDRDPGVRSAALLAFARGGEPGAVTTLLQRVAAGDPAPMVRQLAQDLLAGRGA